VNTFWKRWKYYDFSSAGDFYVVYDILFPARSIKLKRFAHRSGTPQREGRQQR